jgi:hypothetical protein
MSEAVAKGDPCAENLADRKLTALLLIKDKSELILRPEGLICTPFPLE